MLTRTDILKKLQEPTDDREKAFWKHKREVEQARAYIEAQRINCSCTKPKLERLFLPIKNKSGKVIKYKYVYDKKQCPFQHGIRNEAVHQPMLDPYIFLRSSSAEGTEPTEPLDDICFIDTSARILDLHAMDPKTGRPTIKREWSKPNRKKMKYSELSDHDSDYDMSDVVSESEEEGDEENNVDPNTESWQRDHGKQVDVTHDRVQRRLFLSGLQAMADDHDGKILPPRRSVTVVDKENPLLKKERTFGEIQTEEIQEYRRSEMKRKRQATYMWGRDMRTVSSEIHAGSGHTPLLSAETHRKNRRDLEKAILKHGGILLDAETYDALVTPESFEEKMAEGGFLKKQKAPEEPADPPSLDEVANMRDVKKKLSSLKKKKPAISVYMSSDAKSALKHLIVQIMKTEPRRVMGVKKVVEISVRSSPDFLQSLHTAKLRMEMTQLLISDEALQTLEAKARPAFQRYVQPTLVGMLANPERVSAVALRKLEKLCRVLSVKRQDGTMMCEMALPFGKAHMPIHSNWEFNGLHVFLLAKTMQEREKRASKNSTMWRRNGMLLKEVEENHQWIRKTFKESNKTDVKKERLKLCINANWRIITGQQELYS